MAEETPETARPTHDHREIARLNDWLRGNLTSPGANRVTMTIGIAALIGDVAVFRNFRKRAEMLRIVRDFDTFDRSNDPFGEHDLGSFEFEGTPCMWKIDLYEEEEVKGSGKPPVELRVLTVMLASEY